MISKVGLAIYNKPWLIEPESALNLLDMWERMIEGKTSLWQDRQQEEQDRLAEFKKLFTSSAVVFAPTNSWDAKSFKGFQGASIAVIPVQGPLMKSDFCGDFGTASLQNLFRLAEETPSVESIVLLIDSPGGTVDGTESFANTIRNSKKWTEAHIDGYCCSAAYWLASSAKKVVATNKTDVIGSIGTMFAFKDWTENDKQRGIVQREYYASKSTDKNKAFREAKAGDGRMLIQDMLDPTNDVFLTGVKSSRGDKLNLGAEDVLTGKTYLGTKAKSVGLVDAVMPLNQALQQSLKNAQQNRRTIMETNTPFQKTLAAAKAESFSVVEGGFLLEESHLNNIEAALATGAKASEDLTKANEGLAAANKKADEAAKELAAAAEQSQKDKARIQELEGQVAKLGKASASEFTATTTEQDPPKQEATNQKSKYHMAIDDEAAKYN